MCGICGVVNFNQDPVKVAALLKMRDRLQHRGPDDCGAILISFDKKISPARFKKSEDSGGNLDYAIGLAHRRLSIIDLSDNASQPMSDKTGRCHIVYNGEVYNFPEIREELESQGVEFNSRSDTEVVLQAYIRWGVDCLSKFNGMFALAIWDGVENKLFLARDRFGKKPLYYYLTEGGGVVFASELTALLLYKAVPPKLSYPALNCFLALGYILSPLTMYEGIEKLEPAHFILASEGGSKFIKQRYWNYAELFRKKTSDKKEEAADKILFLLKQAVRRRMISDVPIGAFLSGGLDSSSVVALMKEYHQGDLHTFSIGFADETYNELPDADRAARYLGTIHHNKVCEMDDQLLSLYQAIDAYDELFSDTSLVPMVEVARLASQYVKVVLSGDGADEIFAGYITHKASRYHRYFSILPSAFKRWMLDILNRYLPVQSRKLSFEYKAKQFLYGSLNTPQCAHYLWRNIFLPEERINILGEKYRELVYTTDPFTHFQRHYEEVADLNMFDRHLYVDAKTWLADDILVKADRAAMNSGIESRSPYLDLDLISYAAALPYEYKVPLLAGIYPYSQKYILKKALRQVLPGFVLKKKKSGFNAPIGRWLKDSSMNEFKLFNQVVFKRKINYAA